MKNYILFVVLLLTNPFVFGQRNFEPGYILQNGDTIHGLVSQKDVVKRSEKVIFKSTQTASEVVYSPQNIGGYGVLKDDHFESKKIGEGDTAAFYFMKVLVLGATNLYTLQDAKQPARYFVYKEGSLRELVRQTRIEKLPSGQKVFKKLNLYQGTLQKLTLDCPSLAASTKNLAFKQKELIAFIRSYNECTAPSSIRYEARQEKAEYSWGILVGGSTTTLQVDGNYPLVLNKNYTSSFSPLPALQFSSSLPRVSKKLTAHVELGYQKMAFKDQLSDRESFRTNEYDVDIQLSYLKVPLYLRYTIPMGSLKPFFNAGLGLAYAIQHTQDVKVASTTPASGTVTEHRFFLQKIDPEGSTLKLSESFRGFSQSFLVGTGVSFSLKSKHSVSLEARYELGNGFSDIENIRTKLSQAILLAGYSF